LKGLWLARAHARRKQVNDLLKQKSQALGDCKGNCQQNSTQTGRKREKSTKPSSNWGMMTSGNTDGEMTEIGSERKQEFVKGEAGDGPSESERTHSPEGRQAATRRYREAYQKYRRMTEAALDTEPIPLGHRQTIRRYFELIRPRDADPEPDAKPATPGDPDSKAKASAPPREG
jgi:hypothetical protein